MGQVILAVKKVPRMSPGDLQELHNMYMAVCNAPYKHLIHS